ncbi:uncharacterized protein Tco025E_08736, partial [Trypanosoma conorhini]
RGLLGGLRVLSKGILNDETHPAQAGPLHRPLADASARVQKGGGWQGQVEETVSALLQPFEGVLHLTCLLLQTCKGFGRVAGRRHMTDFLQKGIHVTAKFIQH